MDEAEGRDDDDMELRGPGPANCDVARLQHIAGDGSAPQLPEPALYLPRHLAAQGIIAGNPFARYPAGESGDPHAVHAFPRGPPLGPEARTHEGAGSRRYIHAFHLSRSRITSQKVHPGQMRLAPEILGIGEARPAGGEALVAALPDLDQVARQDREGRPLLQAQLKSFRG